MTPVVFAGFYPVDPSNPAPFEKCIRALTLNDPSVDVQRDTSSLGNGYRLGFLGQILTGEPWWVVSVMILFLSFIFCF